MEIPAADVEEPLPPLEPELLRLAEAVAIQVQNKRATDVALLRMDGLVYYADLFLLATAPGAGAASRMATALIKHIREEFGLRPMGVEGLEAGQWVLIDFGELVVHLFNEPKRSFYNLDALWSDAEKLPVPHVDEPEAPPLFTVS